ncbi:glyoxylase I 4-like [Diospyros lotus]|uniref:glyoxylase I 4-like n=1 Tax=Diospyros lotus TaxID=55363 RepID=UPI00225AD9EE|nr:glyoxylase I 4-like [Diospyros lotus]
MVIDGTTMMSYCSSEPLPLLSLNHVSLLVRSVWASVRFYEEVLGFCLVQRPSSFNFHGAWLFNYGIGIHLLEDDQSIDDEYHAAMATPRPINPKDNHISFECTDVELVKRRLEQMGVRYVTVVVEDGGAVVEQVFFHDPDGYMIEICNCNNFPILPVSSGSFKPPEFFWGSAGVRREDGEPEPWI